MAVRVESTPAVAEIRPLVAPIVRLGFATKGAIYLLMGVLAFGLASGIGGRITDPSGVLHAFVKQPFGWIVLTVMGAALLAYGVWQVVQALPGPTRPRQRATHWADAALSAIKGFVYGSIGWEAVQLVVARRADSTSADQLTREAMQAPFGDWLVILIGIGLASYGVLQLWMSWTNRFDEDVNAAALRRGGLSWVLWIGRAGIGSRGIILVVMGIALVRAGAIESPSEAAGVAESLWTLFSQPFGRWLLAATGAGLACYGLFEILHARYARV
jgi:hypothetical protein